MLFQGLTGTTRNSDGSNPTIRTGKDGELAGLMNGEYYENAYRARLFTAGATVTAPVIYSTAAGTGGPLLWNGSATVNLVLLKVGVSSSVVTTVAGALGLTGAAGQPVAPTATTAIDYPTVNMFIGGAAALATAYRVGTPLVAGNRFIPLMAFHTGALTVDTTATAWFDIGGALIAPPQTWISLAGSATLTTLVVQTTFVWAEIPV